MKFRFTFNDGDRFTRFTGAESNVSDVKFKLREFIKNIEEVFDVIPICTRLHIDSNNVEVDLISFENALKEADEKK